MEELLHKYMRGDISSVELDLLKAKLKDLPDSELENIFANIWQNHEFPTDITSDDYVKLRQLKNRIFYRTSRTPTRYNLVTFFTAAAILSIILTLVTYLILPVQITSTNYSADMVMVQTAAGERATAYLPDGTIVSMNYASQLTWDETSFNHKSRCVKFEGEGFFQVSKNASLPFEIESGQLTVRVTGTSFNLRWRADKNIAQLYLISGSVQLTSGITGECISVKPGQLADFDSQTGLLECHDQPETGLDQTRWRDNELVFNASPLSHVISELSGSYGIQITMAPGINPQTKFTGTLPGGDLLEAMHTLEVTFGLVTRIHGGTVELIPYP